MPCDVAKRPVPVMAGRADAGRGPRRRRLSRSAEFERVYRQGRSKANRFLVLYAFPREAPESGDADEGPRLGLSVSRKVGVAVSLVESFAATPSGQEEAT